MDFIKRTWAEIDLDALDYNIKSIKSKMEPEHKVMGIVKADAYGHGDGFVARKLQAGGFDWFGVSNIEEGMSLRNEGITKTHSGSWLHTRKLRRNSLPAEHYKRNRRD